MDWETLDVASLLGQHLPEETTSANVGSYPVPLGQVLRRPPVSNVSDDGLDIPDEYREMLGLK